MLQGGAEPRVDRARFLCAQLAFWLLAATDGHAKNFSIFHKGMETYALTPLYDVLSAWPVIGTGPSEIQWQRAKLAMAVRSKNAHYHLREIEARHWAGLAAATGVPGLWDLMVGMVARVDAALRTVAARLPKGFAAELFERVATGTRAQVQRFENGL